MSVDGVSKPPQFVRSTISLRFYWKYFMTFTFFPATTQCFIHGNQVQSNSYAFCAANFVARPLQHFNLITLSSISLIFCTE